MSLFNNKIKDISLIEVFLLIVVLYIIQYSFNHFKIINVPSFSIYVIVILFFIFKLRNDFDGITGDILSVFSFNLMKYIFGIVILNIFFSYGCLYVSNYILINFPISNILINSSLIGINSFILGSTLASIFISPISEELIFRGVFLNRLKLMVPTTVAILVSSLLFASLHTFGNIFSAFVFALCMAILYLKTDNIFVPICAHFLNNLFAESILALDVNNMIFTNDLVIASMSVMAIISAIIIFISLYFELNSIK